LHLKPILGKTVIDHALHEFICFQHIVQRASCPAANTLGTNIIAANIATIIFFIEISVLLTQAKYLNFTAK